jgi:hypothetical protein
LLLLLLLLLLLYCCTPGAVPVQAVGLLHQAVQ